ncbi:MAG: riboflavin kinase / adenylyltransferase [Patescibacteria group bacterium]|nr:riboflavin kinase / adenylyltransferase [Patescibacteria group bacterium]
MNSIIKGKVIKGDGYGKKIGYPTINIDRRNFLSLKEKPDFGVYAGVVELENKKYRAGIIIGPLDKKRKPKIEAHLIGYKSNAYGKSVVFNLRKFIREFKHFKTEKELIAQIGKDLNKC